MSTHNICFRGEIRKILSGFSPYLDLCIYVSFDKKSGYFLCEFAQRG